MHLNCLRGTLDVLKSSPFKAIEIGSVCPSLELISRLLARKFLLDHTSFHSLHIVELFHEVASLWRFVPSRLPILATYAYNIQLCEPYILKNENHLPIYATSFSVLLKKLDITIKPLFLNTSRAFLNGLQNYTVDALFQNFINTHFPKFTIVFTDGLMSETSASDSSYIQKTELSSYGNLPTLFSNFLLYIIILYIIICSPSLILQP